MQTFSTPPAQPIFGSGLARSGGGLYSNCLSAHPEMMVACCPNLELFRSFRNAAVRDSADRALIEAVPPKLALQDYYGTDLRLKALDLLMDADLSLPFDPSEWERFHDISVTRGELESPDLVQHFQRLKGSTYREMFLNLLHLIADARHCHDRKWIGLHEVWIVDFYPALARAFPEAKFLIMFRDPRAIISSMLGVEKKHPEQIAQTLSYARHWRKYAALALKYSQSALFKGRLHITAHDLLLTQPEATVSRICQAFDIDFDERMLDTDNYVQFSTGKPWAGNSSFEETTSGISAHRATRWKEKLDPIVVKTIEYICGPEMKLVGYPTVTEYAGIDAELDGPVAAHLLKGHTSYALWRSDIGDPLLDLGLEQVRRSLLKLPSASEDVSLVRRCFLFQDVYEALRKGQGPLLPLRVNL